MLANGSGKSRATREGGGRPAARWRVLYLSSGEVGLVDKNAEGKRQTKAGQEVRLIDIAADAGAGFGIFDDIGEAGTADKFSDLLRVACRKNFGTAGPAFLEFLLEKIESDFEFAVVIRRWIDVVVNDWLRHQPAAGGQVRSVARRFALIAVAGELAVEADIVPWDKSEAISAAGVIFRGWLGERGTVGASEDLQAKRQLAAFIGRYGAGRFDFWGKLTKNADGEVILEESLNVDRSKTLIRAGWRRVVTLDDGGSSFDYYLFDNAMREALAGLHFKNSIKTLRAAGMILPDPAGRSQTTARPPGAGKAMRLYRVPGHVAGWDGDAGSED